MSWKYQLFLPKMPIFYLYSFRSATEYSPMKVHELWQEYLLVFYNKRKSPELLTMGGRDRYLRFKLLPTFLDAASPWLLNQGRAWYKHQKLAIISHITIEFYTRYNHSSLIMCFKNLKNVSWTNGGSSAFLPSLTW